MGVAWLVGLGAMWLSERGQHPYRGPDTISAILLGVWLVSRHGLLSRLASAFMSEPELDPIIHAPTRLRVVASLAMTHLRKLDEAGYVAKTSVHLTHAGRAAFERYSAVSRGLLEPG